MEEDAFTTSELQWLEEDQRLWKRASAVARTHPNVDVEGVYHVLRNLERSPAERLRLALSRGRLGADRR